MKSDSTDRHLLRLLAGLPAVVALLGGVLALHLLSSNKPQRLDWCQATASNAADNRDCETAAVCYARLLQAHPSDQATAFNLAESLEALGQAESARSLMARLASPEGGSFIPAHLWLARQTLLEPNPSKDALDAAADHLGRAMRSDPQDPQVNYWSAVLRARQGRWDDAEKAAEKTQDRYAALCETLRQIASSQGNAVQADYWASRGH